MAKKKLPPGVRERDGRFTFRYSIDVYIDGKKVRKQKETGAYATAKEAYDAGTIIRAQQLQGDYVDEKNILFEQWMEKFLKVYGTSGKKENTVRTRRSRLNIALKRFKGRKLKEITAFEYQEFLDGLRDEGKSKSTVTLTHSAMRLMFGKAAKPPYSLIGRDITRDVEFPEFSLSIEDLEQMDVTELFLEKEDLVRFLGAAKEIAAEATTDEDRFKFEQLHRAMFVLAYTGLRGGELCALTPKYINEAEKQIRVLKTLYYANGVEQYKLGTPKTKTSVRSVDVTDRVLAILREQDHEKKKYRLLIGKRFNKIDDDFVFVNSKTLPGYPMSPRDIEEHMKRVLERANLPLHLTPHNLRHTYTSLSAEAEIDINYIQRQLGHTKDAATTRVYNHVTKAHGRNQMAKLDAVIDGIGK